MSAPNVFERIEIKVQDPMGSGQVFDANFDQYELMMIQRYLNIGLATYHYLIANCPCYRFDVADAILAELIRQGWICKPSKE